MMKQDIEEKSNQQLFKLIEDPQSLTIKKKLKLTDHYN